METALCLQVRVWWPLLLNRLPGVYLRVLPPAGWLAVAQDTNHTAGVWGVTVCPLAVLPLRAIFSRHPHQSCYVHRRNWWVLHELTVKVLAVLNSGARTCKNYWGGAHWGVWGLIPQAKGVGDILKWRNLMVHHQIYLLKSIIEFQRVMINQNSEQKP